MGAGGGGLFFSSTLGAREFFSSVAGCFGTTAVRVISGEASSAGVLTETGNHAFNVSCTRGRFVV